MRLFSGCYVEHYDRLQRQLSNRSMLVLLTIECYFSYISLITSIFTTKKYSTSSSLTSACFVEIFLNLNPHPEKK